MLVYHTFETLSAADSGKQHKFSWYTDGGQFLCHAMYQSGSDTIAIGGGAAAPRGKVLRLQFDEKGDTAPGHGIAVQVDGDDWQALDYQRLTGQIGAAVEHTSPALRVQAKAAALSQLASLYNLMATRYGDVFENDTAVPLHTPQENTPSGWRHSIDRLITSPRMAALSQWAGRQALDVLAGKPDATASPHLPPEEAASTPLLPTMWWHHLIDVEAGSKWHKFAFQHKDREITAAVYQSGDLGEKVGIQQRRIDPKKKPRPRAERFDVRIDNANAAEAAAQPMLLPPGSIVAAGLNAHKVQQALQNDEITQEQAAAAFIMLASVYRLAATGYGMPFGYDWHGEKLKPYLLDESPRHRAIAGKNAPRDAAKDIFIVNGRRYQRPAHVHDEASLRAFIREPEADKAAGESMDFAARALFGKPLDLRRLGEIVLEDMHLYATNGARTR